MSKRETVLIPLRGLLLMVVAILLSMTAAAESRSAAMKRADRELRQGNYELAERIYRQLVEHNADDNDARLGLSFALIKRVQLQEAFQEAARVVAVDPLNARAHTLMGMALLRSGEFRISVEALKTGLKFNAKESLAWAGLAEVEFFENRPKSAYDGLKRAVSLDPNEPDNYVALARACSRLELYAEAADSYSRFLEVAPKTDAERRARIRGLIDFYRYLGTTKINRTSGPEVTTLAFEVLRYRPYINVMVNGKGPLRFVIDTGASLSVLSDKAAANLGVRAVAHGGNARAVGGTGSFPIVYGVLDSLSIGSARIDYVPIYIRTVHSAPDAPKAEMVDGYIGLSVLASFSLTLDYQNKVMTLDRTALRDEPAATDKPAQVDTDGIDVPIRSTSGGLTSAEAHLDSAPLPLNFIVDTGATSTVISKAAVKRNGLEKLKLKDTTFRVVGAAGIEDGAEAIGLEALTVNGLRQNNARALILDLEPVNETSGFEQHGILGGDYLSHFRVQLDLRRYRLRLTPQSPAIKVASQW
jgi:predicted aspartyl protease/Flp pilus assembly protein TadD